MGGRARRFGIGAALLLGLATMVTGAASAGAETPPEPPPAPSCTRLGVIGDSLTRQSQVPLASALRSLGIEEFRIDALGFRAVETHAHSGLQALRTMRRAGYTMDCYVVALGVNDVIASKRLSDYTKWIGDMLDAIGDHPVLWVGPGARGALPTSIDRFYDALATVSAARPQLTVADWRPLVAAHRDWIRLDGIHLTAAGRVGRAQWIAGLVSSVLFDGQPSPVPAADCVIGRTLRRGMTGPDVACLEHRLTALGYALVPGPDDRFDAGTELAVTDFQNYAGFWGLGHVGQRTGRLLGIWAT